MNRDDRDVCNDKRLVVFFAQLWLGASYFFWLTLQRRVVTICDTLFNFTLLCFLLANLIFVFPVFFNVVQWLGYENESEVQSPVAKTEFFFFLPFFSTLLSFHLFSSPEHPDHLWGPKPDESSPHPNSFYKVCFNIILYLWNPPPSQGSTSFNFSHQFLHFYFIYFSTSYIFRKDPPELIWCKCLFLFPVLSLLQLTQLTFKHRASST